MRSFGFVGALVGLLAASAAGQQDAVTIKVRTPKAGDRLKVTKTEKSTATTTFTAGGQTQSKDEGGTTSMAYVDEIITPGEGSGKPLKLTRTYEKYEVTKGEKNEPAPPLKTAILIEKKGDKYEFSADGKPLDAAVAGKLSGEFNKAGGTPRAEDLLPGKPVKPGDTWKVEGEKLAKLLGGAGGQFVIDPEKSAVNGKLVKTYLKDGKQFGVVEYDIDLAITSLGEKGAFKMKPGSKMGMKMTMDGCIDGSMTMNTMTGKLSMKIDGEGMGISLTVVADGTVTGTEELLTKK